MTMRTWDSVCVCLRERETERVPVYLLDCGPKRDELFACQSLSHSASATPLQHYFWKGSWDIIVMITLMKRLKGISMKRFEIVQNFYLLANWTKPQPFPTGILTEAISPYWENACLRSSSVTLGSSPPTNIYNESLISYWELVINDKLLKCKTK